MFYTYTWLRPNATPYYVGKGSNDRAFVNDSHRLRKPQDKSRVLIQYWGSEEKAFEMEKWWIAFWGRKDNDTGTLRNLTDGGENPPVGMRKGIKHSEEYKQRMKIAHSNPSEETRRKMSLSAKKRHGTLEGREVQKINGLKGAAARWNCSEVKVRIPSAETRLKMSLSGKKVWERKRKLEVANVN